MAIAFGPQIGKQPQLGFQKINMAFFVSDQFLKQGFGREIPDGIAVFARFDIQGACIQLGGQIALQRFLDGLPDPQAVELLQVRVPLKKALARRLLPLAGLCFPIPLQEIGRAHV